MNDKQIGIKALIAVALVGLIIGICVASSGIKLPQNKVEVGQIYFDDSNNPFEINAVRVVSVKDGYVRSKGIISNSKIEEGWEEIDSMGMFKYRYERNKQLEKIFLIKYPKQVYAKPIKYDWEDDLKIEQLENKIKKLEATIKKLKEENAYPFRFSVASNFVETIDASNVHTAPTNESYIAVYIHSNDTFSSLCATNQIPDIDTSAYYLSKYQVEGANWGTNRIERNKCND